MLSKSQRSVATTHDVAASPFTPRNSTLQDRPGGAGARGGAGGGERRRRDRGRGGRGPRDVEGGLDGVNGLLRGPPAAELHSGEPELTAGLGGGGCRVS